MTQELLRLHDAKVKMDGRVILDVDDFVINQGERIVVLGPNGSGKSTLVKLLTKEIEPVWRETPPVLFMGQPDPSEETLIETVGLVSTDVQERMMVHRTVFDIVLGGFFGRPARPFAKSASRRCPSVTCSRFPRDRHVARSLPARSSTVPRC